FTKNRPRLLARDAGRALFDEVVWAADQEGLLSDEHFSVDGALIEAAASLKSFQPKEGPPPPADDDPGNPVGGLPRGTPEQRDARQHHGSRGAPVAQGAGQGSPAGVPGPGPDGNRHGLLMDFTVSPATGTTRPAGYAVSLRIRKRVEEVFGWMKTVGGLRRTRYRGVARTGLAGYLVATAYNLVRMANLMSEPETAGGRAGGFRAHRATSTPDSAHPRGDRCHPRPILQQPVSSC
ncbi:MAG: transposase, partial [Caldilineaceae bacterium]|nr:transposase [Caldilineaceae bacterium]